MFPKSDMPVIVAAEAGAGTRILHRLIRPERSLFITMREEVGGRFKGTLCGHRASVGKLRQSLRGYQGQRLLDVLRLKHFSENHHGRWSVKAL